MNREHQLVTLEHVDSGRYWKALFCVHKWSESTDHQGLLQTRGDEQIYGTQDVSYCSKCDAVKSANYKEISRGPIERESRSD